MTQAQSPASQCLNDGVEAGEMPATLNIDWRGRASGVCVMAMAASLALTPWHAGAAMVATACLIAVFVLNLGFYRLCLRKGGVAFAAGAFALHVLYYLYASATFGVLAAGHRVVGLARRLVSGAGGVARPRSR